MHRLFKHPLFIIIGFCSQNFLQLVISWFWKPLEAMSLSPSYSDWIPKGIEWCWKKISAIYHWMCSYGFGIGNTSSYFLRIGMPILGPTLSKLFNLIIFQTSGNSPCKIPIFKEGSTEEKSNYRPVSVIPVVSRLFDWKNYIRSTLFLSL